MARVELNIVALGDFKSVNTQIAALKAQIESLNKNLAGVGLNNGLVKDLNAAQAAFKATMLSTGQFTAQTIKLKSETDKFGEALVGGKLKLNEYFNIIRNRSSQASAQMRALAVEQTKLQNSIVMADPTKQGIFSVFTPTRINEVANATKIATNMQNIYNIAVEKGTQSLINWGKNTQWAGRQLTVGLTVPMAIFGSTAMKTFQEVNDQIVRLQKVYGSGITQPTAAALAEIKSQTLGLAKELASSMGIAAKETTAMAADLAATGLQGQDLIAGTREAMRLAKLGELDTQQAMQATVSLQNVYKLSTQELSGAVNFLNAVENQTSTSLQDLVDGIPRVGPIVQQLGGSFKDTAIMMVAMKEAGVPAAQSANAIKSALASLINPTKAARDAFAEYNINVAGIAKATDGNPVQMIQLLQQSMQKLEPLAKAQLIEKLFGKYQQARIQALIGNLGSLNSQTKTAFDLVNASAPQLASLAAKELSVATESTTGKFKRAVETIKADLIPVGEKVMQIATKLLEFGDAVGKTFGNLPGPVKSLFGLLAGGVALAGPLIMLTGVLANFVGYLLKGMFGIKSLVTGTKTLGELLTPNLIASQQAAQLFGAGILEDTAAVGLLNQAVRELTISINGMASSMGAASMANATGAIASGLILPGMPGFRRKMATGGIVPGTGSGDTVPAMLTPGESVVTKQATEKYGAIIQAMNKGTLPGFAYGVVGAGKPNAGQNIEIQRGHVLPEHGGDIFNAINQPSMLAQAGLSSLQSVTRGAMVGQPALVNQRTKEGNAGISAADALEEYTKVINANVDPMENLKNNAKKLGANMADATPKLDNAFNGMMEGLRAAAKDPNHPGFGKNPGQIPFEEFSGSYTSPAMESIPTKTGGTLGRVMNSIIGTRGTRTKGSKRGSATAGTFVRTEDGTIVPFGQSNLSGVLSENDVATKGSYAMSNVFKRISSRSKKMLKINTPSQVIADEIGEPISEGMGKGINDAASHVEDAVGKTIDKAEKKAKEKTEKKSFMSSGKGQLVGSMGMMAGSMALNSAPNFAGKDMLQSAMSMGSMGMMFGPWGAAAGAALGLVTTGIGKLIEKEKEHARIVKDTFSVSAEDVKMFGDAVLDTSIKINALPDTTKKAKDKFGSIPEKVKGYVDQFSGLAKDDPTAVFIENLRKTDKLSSVTGNIKSKVSTAISIGGMDPKNAKDYVQALLIAANRTKDFGKVWANVQVGLATSGNSTKTMFDKLNQSVKETSAGYYYGTNATNVQAKSYNLLNAEQKATADTMLNLFNIVGNGALKYDAIVGRLKGLTSSSLTAGNAVVALGAAINASNNPDLIARYKGIIDMIERTGASARITASDIMKINLAQQMGIGEAELRAWGSKQGMRKVVGGLPTLYLKYFNSPEFKKLLEGYNKITESLNPTRTVPGLGSGDTFNTKPYDAAIKAQEAILKPLEAELKTRKEIADQQKRSIDFATTQTDLQNQIIRAQASGDYLKANLLRQELAGKGDEFAQATAENKNTIMIDKMKEHIADITAAKYDKSPLTSALKQVVTGKLIDYKAGSYSIPSAMSYGASTVLGSSTSVNAGGTVINLTINANGMNTNDIIPVVTKAVQNAAKGAKVTAAKNGTTTKVGKP